jgi:hypothetical protein
MALDIRNLSPAEAIRLLNSTRLGTVTDERRLYRHRQLGGLRIGDSRHIHLVRYVAWLVAQVEKAACAENALTKADDMSRQYEQHKARAARRQAAIAEAGQEIGPPPPPVNPERREACRRNFKLFCETYLGGIFRLAWSPDHLRAIAKIERAVLNGELFAFAMPRGSGKTSLCEAAVLWAVLYGHHKFVCLIAATERRARKLLQVGVWSPLEKNPLLFEDFPEVCYPIRKLERTSQKARKQKCNGRYTDMLWTKNEIVLPTVWLEQPGPDGQPLAVASAASGTIVTVCGLTGGEILGQNKDMPDGTLARPSLVLLDDPQTRDSAKSPTQTQDRIELLQGAVLGMAGPDKSIAGMMPCTVIKPLDMADQILDQEKHPEWHGERTKLVYAFPTAEKLWDDYADLLRAGLRRGDTLAALEFYRKHRPAMDAGSQVAWPERFVPEKGEISAIQHAMNLRIRDEAMFASEFQNEPLVAREEDDFLDADAIAAKLNRRAEGSVPTSCTRLVMMVDVQKKCLYYLVLAVEPAFTCYVVEYGAWPDQKTHAFAYRSIRRTLAMTHRGHGEEAAILAGLDELTAAKVGREWRRDDGAAMRINCCLIDAGNWKDTIELHCRQTRFPGIVMPSRGLPVTAASIPMDERKRKKGEEVGDNWRLSGRQGEHSVRLLFFDANHWKTFAQTRLATPMGDKGCCSLWGRSSARHRMLADHLTAEFRTRTSGRGREVDEWKELTGRDNHLLDCLVGCMVAASYQGCRVHGARAERPVVKRVPLSQMGRRH